MKFEKAEKYRLQRAVAHLPATKPGDPFGVFLIGVPNVSQLRMIVTAGDQTEGFHWEHVWVTKLIWRKGKAVPITPTWEEMCQVKDLFWDPQECVIQFHPPKSEYVNNHNHCLHLWRKIGENAETPPKECV